MVVVLPLAGLTACADPAGVDDGRAEVVDEMTAHDGEVCPNRLPQGKDPGYGFGTATSAESAPSLTEPESAWVCKYDPSVADAGTDGDAKRASWIRVGRTTPVSASQLAALARDLTKLAPAERSRSCTADLGPRWMLVYFHGKDLTGVVVDDFGCREVRLTDDPFGTEPGAASQPGTVPGVLLGPATLLGTIKAIHPS